MNTDTSLILLGELFAIMCLFVSFKVKRKQTQMILFAAFLFSTGIIAIAIGAFFVKSSDSILLFPGLVLIVFGGISTGMGAENIFLFWKNDEAS